MNPVKPSKVEWVPLDKLILYANNARTHSERNIGKLAASLKEFGWTNPVLISGSGEVIAGHGRIVAARTLEMESVPCLRMTHLSPAQVQTYRLADNRLGLDSDWDMELLASELKDIEAGGEIDLSFTGFDDAELDGFLSQSDGKEDIPVVHSEEQAEAIREKWGAESGQLWRLGSHRILCADSTDAVAVRRLLDGVDLKLMVTDPPYGVDYDPTWRESQNSRGSIGASFDYVANDHRAEWSKAFEVYEGPIAYVWHGGLHAAEVAAGLENLGFEIRAQLIWVKQMAALSRGHYSWQHEPCWYAVRKGKTANWKGNPYESTVMTVNTLSPLGGGSDDPLDERTTHAAQKPVELMRRPILLHTERGDAVYDPFMGSGTTLMAAHSVGRVAYGCELLPKFVAMILQRFHEFTKIKPERVS